jgi:hypothetical protein
MTIVGRHQQQAGAIRRTATHHNNIGLVAELFPIAFHLNGGDGTPL